MEYSPFIVGSDHKHPVEREDGDQRPENEQEIKAQLAEEAEIIRFFLNIRSVLMLFCLQSLRLNLWKSAY